MDMVKGTKRCTAIVLAAGSGSRMQSAVAKQYMLLKDKPLIWYALHIFEESEIIDDIILVAGKGEVPYCTQEIVERYGFRKVSAVVEGGAERYLSVWEALCYIKDKGLRARSEEAYVFIHDGARPFVTEDMIEAAFKAVVEYRACVVGMPVKDTIKIADENGFAVQTPDRRLTWAVQTPQVFEEGLIIEAYTCLMNHQHTMQVTDDAMVVEAMLSHPIKLMEGSYENIKITTPSDLLIADCLERTKTK